MLDGEGKMIVAVGVVFVVVFIVIAIVGSSSLSDYQTECSDKKGTVVKTPAGWQCIDATKIK